MHIIAPPQDQVPRACVSMIFTVRKQNIRTRRRSHRYMPPVFPPAGQLHTMLPHVLSTYVPWGAYRPSLRAHILTHAHGRSRETECAAIISIDPEGFSTRGLRLGVAFVPPHTYVHSTPLRMRKQNETGDQANPACGVDDRAMNLIQWNTIVGLNGSMSIASLAGGRYISPEAIPASGSELQHASFRAREPTASQAGTLIPGRL
ncbi:hypothetical protein L226DRAFT_94365 [Lentinus tigrinus ALCF2SS1-7]|uniref:uncharacterized protein n=1 Tax=Lentinus tigrinus ALCF2SS1-7 TaxID=1328758 RepID=UPI0011660E5B|nr:hypothetical protein L226DRAFT_94365 [Lentinus tigrinus ALCF2SS1-7]